MLAGEPVAADRGVTVEHAVDDPAQRAGALAVHDPDPGQAGVLRGLEVLGDEVGAVARPERVQVELVGERRRHGGIAGPGRPAVVEQVGVEFVGAGGRGAWPWATPASARRRG